MPKYTPGVWHAHRIEKEGPYKDHFLIYSRLPNPTTPGSRRFFHQSVAATMPIDGQVAPEEEEANADLIAAAPELLEGLESAIAALRILYRVTPQVFAEGEEGLLHLEALVKKARGERDNDVEVENDTAYLEQVYEAGNDIDF